MCTKRGGTKEHTVLCLLYLSGGLTSSAAAILAGVSISCDSNRPLQKKNNSPGIIYINLILYTTTNMTLESTDVHKLVCVYQILNRMYSELQIEEEAWNFYKRTTGCSLNIVFIFHKIFLNSASSAAALLFYLPGACTHTDTEGKQGKASVRNILRSSEKYLNIFLFATRCKHCQYWQNAPQKLYAWKT